MLGLLAALAWPAFSGLSVQARLINAPGFRVSGLRLDITDSRLSLVASRLEAGGQTFSALRAECGRFSRLADGFVCDNAFLSAAEFKERLPIRLSQRAGVFDLRLWPASNEQWQLRRKEDGGVELSIRQGRLERLRSFLPGIKDWSLAGRLEANVRLTALSVTGRATVHDLDFSDQAGEHAAEKLSLELAVDARRARTGWSWQTHLKWLGGDAFWQPFYVKGQGQVLSAQGKVFGQKIEVSDARLHLPEVGDLIASGEWDNRVGGLTQARLASQAMDLNRGGERYLNPLLTALGVPEMRYGGQLAFDLAWDQKGLARVGVALTGVSLHEPRGRWSVSGIRGHLPWQREGGVRGHLSAAQANLGDLPLGAFELPLHISPQRLSVDRTEIPVLDSALVIERLVWRKSSKRQAWEGDLGLSIKPVQLADLTAAFGLPKLVGTLSASFPHLRYRDNAVYLDGLLEAQIFEGTLQCTHLRLEDPLGTVPRLSADVAARRINLGQLTEAFSFGRMTGYADADIKNLELAAWKPVQFDARIMSSEGDYRKRISQRAVQNISSLGGAGAGAAIQASFLRFFEEFGYEKIGLSCRLRGGVCDMGGIEKSAHGYVMVKGGGMPALTVIGYNRNVDWTELVDRIQAAIRTNTAPVVQ